MIVFDTDIVTLFSYGKNESLNQKVSEMIETEQFAITLITHMEILRGRFDNILKAADATEMQRATERYQVAESMMSLFDLLYPDEESSRHFESLIKPKKGKKKMKRPDMIIASIVLSHNALLVTRNIKDFVDVHNLRIENWAN